MCQLHLPNDQVIGIKYFTAKIISRPDDPNKHIRQQVYLRALETLPNVQVIFGHYSAHVKWMRLANSSPGKPKFAQVIRTDEKGSDVNLAVNLIHDAYQAKFELALIVSNDSDLLSAIQIVQNDLGLKVGVLNPHKNQSQSLMKEAFFFKNIRKGILKGSQFPQTMKDSRGAFYKPVDW